MFFISIKLIHITAALASSSKTFNTKLSIHRFIQVILTGIPYSPAYLPFVDGTVKFKKIIQNNRRPLETLR